MFTLEHVQFPSSRAIKALVKINKQNQLSALLSQTTFNHLLFCPLHPLPQSFPLPQARNHPFLFITTTNQPNSWLVAGWLRLKVFDL
ncbi:hypothetical protein Pfo_014717 [Paulownia fortunei]|nr:hypothetical protein Pfo_014717 [Paulownia fortunei]